MLTLFCFEYVSLILFEISLCGCVFTCRISSEKDGLKACRVLHEAGPSKVRSSTNHELLFFFLKSYHFLYMSFDHIPLPISGSNNQLEHGRRTLSDWQSPEIKGIILAFSSVSVYNI